MQGTMHEGTQTALLLHPLINYKTSKTFSLKNIKRHEGNAELRTILFKEGGIDAIMKSPQSNIKLGHNCITTLTKYFKSSCTKLAGPCLYKGNHPQFGLSMNMGSIQGQIRTQGSIPIYVRPNRKLAQCKQVTKQTEHQPGEQLTLRALKHPAWCVCEHETSRHGIFGHGRRGQDSKNTQRDLTKPRGTAARSPTRQFLDTG